MQTLVNEVLSFDSRMCYMKIKQEISFIQAQHFQDTNEEIEAKIRRNRLWTDEEKKGELPRREEEPQKQLSLP